MFIHHVNMEKLLTTNSVLATPFLAIHKINFHFWGHLKQGQIT
jgi:hypothetical protein